MIVRTEAWMKLQRRVIEWVDDAIDDLKAEAGVEDTVERVIRGSELWDKPSERLAATAGSELKIRKITTTYDKETQTLHCSFTLSSVFMSLIQQGKLARKLYNLTLDPNA